MKGMDEIFEQLEEKGEDLIMIALIVLSIAIMVGAFASFRAEKDTSAQQEASIISERISEYSFFQRLNYLGSVFFPWILMLSSTVIAREVWLYRRGLFEEES